MKRSVSVLVILAFLAPLIVAQDLSSRFNAGEMRQRVIRLSSDEFEGRGPGTEGGRKAAQYIADQMKAAGIAPANRGSYFQNVPLVGLKADPATELRIAGKSGTETFRFGDDYVVTTGAQSDHVAVNADLVFVGYGIDAPQYKWNDYKGDPSLFRGKILVMLVNDPPATSAEPQLFGGKALTYYGRWTYKYEEAVRRGAAGVLLIHTTESAGYGWNVVRTSNGSWRYEIARTPADKTPFVKIKGWMTNETAKKIFGNAKLNLDDLRKAAQTRDFRPVNMGTTASLDLRSELKRLQSPNVVGMVKGSDPKLSSQYVVFSAHWDHLGIGEPDKNGDRIFNGAYDNASGVAAILGIGEVLAKMPLSERPRRSVLILSPTAEEQGLLGAEYYATHPLFPLSRTAADINIDGVNFFGKVSDFSPLGANKSTLSGLINEVASERSMTVKPDTRPEQGF
ncbi:MAG TPA: M28 family peptidase, partial [Pyrinomonadaceae bacterium]